MPDPVVETVKAFAWLDIAVLCALVGTVLALLKFNQTAKEVARQNGRVEEKVTSNAAVTGQIQAGVGELRRTNDEAHTRIHERIETLPCTDHAAKIGAVEAVAHPKEG